MARTRETGPRRATRAAAADELEDPPPRADDDDDDADLFDDDEEEDNGGDNLDANIRADTIAMFQRVLTFREGAATALYDDQQVTDFESLRELDDDAIKELCRSIAKEGHPISVIAQNRLKLLVFWAKHMWRTCRGVDELTDVDYDEDIKPLQDQKGLEDSLDESKEPEPPTMTLTPTSAASCFTQMKMYLAKCRGRLGIPLDYVIRAQLKGPLDLPEDAPEDPPAFGKPDSPYMTIDAELTARAAILRIDLTQNQLSQALDILEDKGPFTQTFIQDSARVYDILHTVWGTSQTWTHARAVAGKTKNGRKAYRTLHAQLLGGQQLVASGAAIITKLQSLRFEGERRGFPFDKYVALHVQGHVEHDDLQQYGVDALTETLKIHWFQKGISDKSFEAVRASINATPSNFTTFTAVQEAYVSFYLQQKQTDPPRGRQLSSVSGGRSGGSRTGDRGRGRGGGNRSKGIFSAEELAACKVANRDYSNEEYKKLTPLQKQKLYQLRNPDKQLGTGPSRQSRRGGTDGATVASTNTSGAKRANNDSRGDTDGDDDQTAKSRNRDMSPVAGRQRTGSAKAQKMDKADD